MRLLGAIFDMDGVLLDSNYIWRGLGARFLRRYGVEPEGDLRKAFRHRGLKLNSVFGEHFFQLFDGIFFKKFRLIRCL